jgi:hypothetical protein
LEVAAGDELFDEESGHDGFAGSGVVGEEEAEGLAGEHFLVDGGDLVREGFHEGGVHGQHRIEQMCQLDSMGFGDEAEEATVAVEGPGSAEFGNFEGGLAVAEEEFVSEFALGVLVSEFNGGVPIPFHVNYGDYSVS